VFSANSHAGTTGKSGSVFVTRIVPIAGPFFQCRLQKYVKSAMFCLQSLLAYGKNLTIRCISSELRQGDRHPSVEERRVAGLPYGHIQFSGPQKGE
jgi:hypothetical protein